MTIQTSDEGFGATRHPRKGLVARALDRLTRAPWSRGRAGSSVERLLAAEKTRDADLPEAVLTPAEQVTAVVAASTAVATVLAARKVLTESVEQLVAACRGVAESADLFKEYLHRTQAEVEVRRSDATRRLETGLAAAPVSVFVSALMLHLAEGIVLLAEVGFWYATFSADISRSAALLSPERISAVLLGLFIPLGGILSARWAGSSLARLVYAANADDTERRAIRASAAASVLTLGVAAVFTAKLVMWRYDEAAVFGAAQFPGDLLAGVFVIVLLVLAGMRVVAINHRAADDRKKDSELKVLEARVAAMRAQNEAKITAWHLATQRLELECAAVLDRVERDIMTGITLVCTSRALRVDAPGQMLPRKGAPTPEVPVDLEAVAAALHVLDSAHRALTRYGARDASDVAAIAEQVRALHDRILGATETPAEGGE